MWRGFQEVCQRTKQGVPPLLFPCSLQSLKKPIIPKEFGGKVPTVIRQRYLNLFIEECLKFCSSNQEAIEKVRDPGGAGPGPGQGGWDPLSGCPGLNGVVFRR